MNNRVVKILRKKSDNRLEFKILKKLYKNTPKDKRSKYLK